MADLQGISVSKALVQSTQTSGLENYMAVQFNAKPAADIVLAANKNCYMQLDITVSDGTTTHTHTIAEKIAGGVSGTTITQANGHDFAPYYPGDETGLLNADNIDTAVVVNAANYFLA